LISAGSNMAKTSVGDTTRQGERRNWGVEMLRRCPVGKKKKGSLMVDFWMLAAVWKKKEKALNPVAEP